MENMFGNFISSKRIKKQISLRTFSYMIGISATYLSKIENGIKPAPTDSILEKIANTLALDEIEKELLFDLAAQSKGTCSLAYDLIKYINENEIIHKTLRISKRCNVSPDDWNDIYILISKKYL